MNGRTRPRLSAPPLPFTALYVAGSPFPTPARDLSGDSPHRPSISHVPTRLATKFLQIPPSIGYTAGVRYKPLTVS